MHPDFAQWIFDRFVEEWSRPLPHFMDSECIVNLSTSLMTKLGLYLPGNGALAWMGFGGTGSNGCSTAGLGGAVLEDSFVS
jgi:hypothetical protein